MINLKSKNKKMKKCEAELKKAYNCKKIEIQNLGFFIFILIFSFSFFNVKETDASFTISRPSTHNLGLVGHWTFDGADVTDKVYDKSVQGNHGYFYNGATTTAKVPGKIGQGFDFDGANDYLDMGDPPSGIFDFGATGNFSISEWVKILSTETSAQFVSKYTGGTTMGWASSLNGDKAESYIRDGTGSGSDEIVVITGNTVINDGRWHHIVTTYDRAGNMSLFVDGVSDATPVSITTVTGTVSSAYNLNIGRKSASGFGYMAGSADDVRIYNRVLSAGEVKMLYNQSASKLNKTPTNALTNGLVGHWTFDGADTNWTTNTTNDRSGNGNNGTMINMSTSTSPAIGRIGQGFNFDGTNDIASTTRINNNEITVAGWFNKTANDFTSTNSDAMFGAYYYNANDQLREGFVLRPGHLVTQPCTGVAAGSGYLCSAFIVITTNGTTKTTKTSTFNLSSISQNGTTTNEWFHIAGTYTQSDGNQRLYINGVLRDTDLHVAGNTVVPLATTTVEACYTYMKIGYSCVNNGYFNGRIDDVRLYNRALSAGEIKILYLMGR